MFLGLKWYGWLVIAVVLLAAIPCKLRFMKWWTARRRKKRQQGTWGDAP